MTYDDAVSELFQAPHGEFVVVRKRLAGELKASDKAGAAKLGKLGRPPISAWAVNQLFWSERALWDELMESAEKVRRGGVAAGTEHQKALAKMRAKAAEILEGAGHGGGEATLRKVTATLSALAVAGGFGDDAPGALQDDREPPGFEAMMGLSAPAVHDKPAAKPAAPEPETDAEDAEAQTKKQAAEDKKRRDDEAHEKRKKEEAARAKKAAARSRLEAALSTARIEAAVRARNVEALKAQLDEAETRVAKADAQVAEIEAELEELDAAED